MARVFGKRATTKVNRRGTRGGSRFDILAKGLVRTRGKMNSAESKYAAMLDGLVLAGDVAWWRFEPFSLRLTECSKGQPARYTPDFLVLMPDGTTFLDDLKSRKGFDDPASLVRIKVAADQYSLWRFRIVRPAGVAYEVKEI